MPAPTGINSTRLHGRFRIFRRDVCREIGCSKMLAICCIQSFERSPVLIYYISTAVRTKQNQRHAGTCMVNYAYLKDKVHIKNKAQSVLQQAHNIGQQTQAYCRWCQNTFRMKLDCSDRQRLTFDVIFFAYSSLERIAWLSCQIKVRNNAND